jgi:hypothetical protein
VTQWHASWTHTLHHVVWVLALFASDASSYVRVTSVKLV